MKKEDKKEYYIFPIRLSKEFKKEYKDYCDKNGYSMTKRIKLLMNNDMGKINNDEKEI